jgi:hypothetical protein
MKIFTRIFIIVIIAFFIFGFTRAETIYLKDGSILKGDISGGDGAILQVKTPHGILKISKDDIKSIEGTPKTVRLKDGTVLKGSIDCLEQAELQVNTKHGAVKVDTKNISVIEFSALSDIEISAPPIKTKKYPFKRIKFFLHFEGFVPNTANDGWKKSINRYINDLASSGVIGSYEMSEKNAFGARFGIMINAGNQTYTGISAGYIVGPHMNVEILASNGVLSDKTETSIKRQMIRGLVELKKHLEINENFDLVLGGGIGMAFGRQELSAWTVTTGNFFNSYAPVTKDYEVFTWEAACGFVIKHPSTKTETHFGVRYMAMPEISAYKDDLGNVLIPKMEWNTFGVYVGFGF